MNAKELKILIYQTNRYFYLTDYFKALKFEVHEAKSLDEVSAELITTDFDVCIVDFFDGRDKFKVLDYVKENTIDMIIAMITASNIEADKIEAYRRGVDIYMAIPYNMEELVYRINNLLGYTRPNVDNSHKYAIGNFTLDCSSRELLDGNGEAVDLGRRLFELLRFMILYKDKIIPKTELLKFVYGEITYQNSKNLDYSIMELRRALKGCTKQIKTIRKIGFIIE